MSEFIAGLDLGQASDPSALIIVEKVEHPAYDPADIKTIFVEPLNGPRWGGYGPEAGTLVYPERKTIRQVLLLPDGTYGDLPPDDEPSYDVRHVQRFKLGTSYPAIVDQVVDMMMQTPLSGHCPLIVDATGVGRPVVDMFYAHRRWNFPLTPVVITGGDAVTHSAGYMHTPKRDLVSTVQVLLQSRRLRFPEASRLPEVATLISELSTFQTKISLATAHDSYGAWREGTHDDLCLALALAVWFGEKRMFRAHAL